MARLAEYYRDPRAPGANSIRPTVFAAVRDEAGRLLLGRRADTGNWELPGGKVGFGESATDAVIREVIEETGVTIAVTGLSGVYTDPAHVMVYASGEVRQQFSVCVHGRPLDGEPRPDHDEMSDAAWFDLADVPGIPVHPTMRLRIEQAVHNPVSPTLV